MNQSLKGATQIDKLCGSFTFLKIHTKQLRNIGYFPNTQYNVCNLTPSAKIPIIEEQVPNHTQIQKSIFKPTFVVISSR
ncbi:hypothetical protein MWU59_09195 [Flavobacteriaceae bacterium F08102]|nr:hypothetical protein [Flavobacteriaceae bacterium F08102]